MKLNSFEHRFVARVPEVLEYGVLYVCLECNVIVHLCACGCGEKVVIAIAPEHWQFQYNGDGVSISPSIGNTYFRCRSHYYIREDKVIWLDKMPERIKTKKKKRNLFSRLMKLF